MNRRVLVGMLALVMLSAQSPARAVTCGGDFNGWLSGFRSEAGTQGISQRTLSTLDEIAPDPRIIALDHRQGVFHESFEQFALPRIAQRLAKAQRLKQQYAGTLQRIEQKFGVPGSVLIAIWGLETDFGVDIGKQPTLRALVTLAHDCRRSEMFQGELIAALQIIDRGDLSASEMRGAWAGELGQAQFLPSNYVKYAVDFEGHGRRDLIRSVPDTLASIANLLKEHGWQAGGGYKEGSANFSVLDAWNKSTIYQRTIAAFAERLDGG
jgi:lytic murein transglycosylase